MAADRSLREGDLIAGYSVVRSIASGALGNVYLAVDHEQGEAPVAVREYLPRGIATRADDGIVRAQLPGAESTFEEGRDRFKDRADTFLGVEHPNLANIRKVVEERGTVYVVMDHAPGESLAARLDPGDTVGERELSAWFVPVAGALSALHDAGLTHGNFGLGTVVVDDDGATKILGLATPTHNEFGIVAKPSHAPLEHYSEGPDLSDARADVYSLGTVLYRCVTGIAPPEAPVRVDRDALVPAARAARGRYRSNVLDAIDAALAVQPDDRPSVNELRDALADALETPAAASDDEPAATKVGARAAVAQARTTKRRTSGPARGRLTFVAVGLVAVAVIGGIAAFLTTEDADVADAELTVTDPPAPTSDALDETDPGAAADVGTPVADASPPSDDATARLPAVAADSEDPAVAISSTEPGPEPPAETTVTPTTGEMTVDTTPPGAEVVVDGTTRGETPLRLTDLETGDYDVLLRHDDYVDYETSVTISTTPAEISHTLVRATGSLEISTTPSAWIDVDGERMADSTPVTLTLPAGPVTLRIAAVGHEPVEVDTRVVKDETATVEYALDPIYGTLTLALAPEDADVVLPDVVEAYAPAMALPVGPHRVTVSREGYAPFTGTVDVSGDTEFVVTLEALGQPLTVVTSPPDAAVAFVGGDLTYAPELSLPPGTYSLQVALPGYAPWTGEVRHGGAPTTAAVSLEFVGAEYADALGSGGDGPMMTVIPAGSFQMGCRAQADCHPTELPTHTVGFASPFAMSKHEVTFNDFDRFARASDRELPDDFGWRRGTRPAINVTWEDAAAYARWLSQETGRAYRLPSEAEWEYAALGGFEAPYGWGDSLTGDANCGDCIPTGGRRTMPVGSFRPNAWGLHDMHGNVWEWVGDCWNASHDGTDANGAVRLSGDCGLRVLRGGSWFEAADFARAAKRLRGRPESRANIVGFRVVADLR